MKAIKFLIVMLAVAGAAFAQVDTLNLLFIGNSHTYYNDLPHLFDSLAVSGGKTVVTDMSAPGGYTLEQHTANANTLAKIAQGGWDYVILQEQSQYPVIEFYRFGSMYPASRHLDSLIHQQGCQTAFFLTWGWRNGGQHTINGHSSPFFIDYFHMQDSMTVAYTQIANELSALLLPAGNAWATARLQDTTIDLWQADNYHPRLAGSYLAACVFYAVFFDESPIGLSYIGGLSPEVADFLQRAADQTISGVNDDVIEKPNSFTLYNFPNPFNGSTQISFDLPKSSHVKVEIFDLLGRNLATLANREFNAGPHILSWDGSDSGGNSVSSGLYFVLAKTGEKNQSLPITLLK